MIAPQELKLRNDRRMLSVTWDDGRTDELSAALLRRSSRAASAVRAAIDDAPTSVAEDIRLTDIQPIGAYAVQLSFSDGHDRGIYPWVYLRDLAARTA
jgi:DUF971 family protein